MPLDSKSDALPPDNRALGLNVPVSKTLDHYNCWGFVVSYDPFVQVLLHKLSEIMAPIYKAFPGLKSVKA